MSRRRQRGSSTNLNVCLICHSSNLKQSESESNDLNQDPDQLLRIFYQCINVQQPLNTDNSTRREFCINCQEYLEEWDNIAMQVALLITRAKRIENTLTSRVLVTQNSSQKTEELFRRHLIRNFIQEFRPVVRLNKLQPTKPPTSSSDNVENLKPVASKIPIISMDDSEEEGNRRIRKYGENRRKSAKGSINDGCPNFNSNSVKKIGHGEYEFNGRIPFAFKDGVFSCRCCFQNFEGPVVHSKKKILSHITKCHSDDLPDWLRTAGFEATEVEVIKLGKYLFRKTVPFSARKTHFKAGGVAFKCQLCPRACSGTVKDCWTEFSMHMALTHMNDLVANAELNASSSPKSLEDCQFDSPSTTDDVIEVIPIQKEEQEEMDSLFEPQVEFGVLNESIPQLDQDSAVKDDPSVVLSSEQDAFLCQICNVLFLDETGLYSHIDLLHSDVFSSDCGAAFESITSESLFNKAEDLDISFEVDDLKIEPESIMGP